MQKQADVNGRRFLETIKALHPPENLQSPHDALVAELSRHEPPPSTLTLRDVQRRVQAIRLHYVALGLDGCRQITEQGIADVEKQLRDQRPPTAP